MRNGKIHIAGVMTGTSGDGVNISLLSVKRGSKIDWEIDISAYYPFPRKLSREIIIFQESKRMEKKEYLRFSTTLANYVALKVSAFISSNFGKKVLSNVAVAYHGQTIAHYPERERVGMGKYSFTLQAGEPAVISRMTGLTVVSDFRQADVAAGGTGAPLTPLFHASLLRKEKGLSAFLNIGGIGNITIIKNGKVMTASDTGPGNMLIDGAVRVFTGGRKRYDRGGKMAKRGNIENKILEFIMDNDDFLFKKKPASTGREQYGEKFLGEILSFADKLNVSEEDLIATLTHYTGQCVALTLKEWGLTGLSKIYVGGGGVKNSALMSALARQLPSVELTSSLAVGVDPDFVESSAFAYFGYCCLAGILSDTTHFTGGGKAILGKITPGENFSSLMKRVHHLQK